MHKILLYLFVILTFYNTCFAKAPCPDYVDALFKKLKIRTLLEFGVNEDTKTYLDACNKVLSVEVVTYGYGPENVKHYMDVYNEYSNWIPLIYFSGYQADMLWAPYKYLGSDHLYKAISYQSSTGKNYALIDDFYLTELNHFILSLVRYNKVDVAHVCSAAAVRGDIIQLLFAKIPVIFAEETKSRHEGVKGDVYGYSRIKTPEDYEEIYIPTAKGVTFWIAKREAYEKLTLALKEISEKI